MTRFVRREGKGKKEAGFTLIAAIIFTALIGFLGVVASFLFTSGTTSTKDFLLSTRAFYAAEGGVEYTARYLKGMANWISPTDPPNQPIALGDGTFTVTFTPVNSNNINAVIVGNSGTAGRAIAASFQRSGYAIRSRGGISLGNNAVLDCDPFNPSNPTCNNTNLNTCPCTVANVSTSNLPAFSVPSPAPAPLSDCSIDSNTTISAGVYYCSGGLTINNNVQITLTGPVTIFTTTFTINNNDFVNTSGSASNMLIMAQGNVTINNNSGFKGAIYAPGYDISISNNVQFTGTVAGGRAGVWNTININNNASFDQTAGTGSSYYNQAGGGGAVTVSLTNWQE